MNHPMVAVRHGVRRAPVIRNCRRGGGQSYSSGVPGILTVREPTDDHEFIGSAF